MTQATISLERIERARQGDPSAFAALFHQYQPRLAIFLHFQMGEHLRRKFEVDDILQEMFLRAFRDLSDFVYRGPGSFSRWLFLIARHTLQDMARFESRFKRQAAEEYSLGSVGQAGVPEPFTRETPSRIFFRKEKVRQLMEDLEALSEEERQLILLAKMEGLSIQEIAEKVGNDKALVSLHLHRALRKLACRRIG